MTESQGTIDVEIIDGTCIVELTGEIDASLRNQASESMVDILACNFDVVIDASEVTFMDSAGLAFMFQVKLAVEADGRAVSLRDPSPVVTDLIDMAGMSGLLRVEDLPPA